MTNDHRTVRNAPLSVPLPRVVYESPPLTPEDVADTNAALASTYARSTSAAGICVADGIGLRLSVNRGALVVVDGVGPHRRERRFHRATHGLRRLVVVGSTGSLTVEALHFCRRLGIGILVLAPDGSPVLTSTPRLTDDARLRRIQALAPDEPVGLGIAKELLSAKLTGQAALVRQRFEDQDTADTIAALVDALGIAESIEEARQIEASAAALHFGAWVGRPECAPTFVSRDRQRIPPHWSRFEGRRSVLASANGNRKAERPVNALLSYCFALAEAEAILACAAVGLDPGLGIGLHLPAKSRQSTALDLIEPLRPQVEGFVLDLLATRTFRKSEFTETSDGHVRLLAPLTHELAETLPRWAQGVAPWAERVAHSLGQAMAGQYQRATPLTGHRSKAAQAAIKARKASARQAASSTVSRQRPSSSAPLPLWSCPGCGGAVENPRHVRCDTCIGADPRQAPELRGRRGAAIAARKRALREWDKTHPGAVYDPELFRREILPRLGRVKLADIMLAAGISKAFASQVRAGTFTPHVSTWEALGGLVGVRIDRT